MYAESDFYQISGYRAHSHGWFKKFDDKPLIQAIMAMRQKLFRPGGQEAPVELVLGILPNGASYLLMTSEQMQTFTLKFRLDIPRSPRRAREFLSLSPIYFNCYQELSDKISMYKCQKQKHGESKDNSKANRGYVWTGSDIVHYRGYFEQQRTLYRLLTRDLEPGKVGLAPPAWLGGVRVVSLIFEEWTTDNRRRADRLNDPLLIDIGWTDVQFPTFFERLTGAPVHFKLQSSAKMVNPDSENPRLSEIVKDDRVGLYSRLRALLGHDATKSGMPLIVLVHDEDMARGILSRAGIDLDAWTSGLSNLLLRPPVGTRQIGRQNGCKVEEGTSDPVILPGPSMIDMQKLVRAVMETGPRNTVPQSAKVLRMQTDTKTCAGDDSLLLLRMWTSMAQGLAIDEQHKARLFHQPACARLLAPPQVLIKAEDDPNDVGPNDVPRPTIADDFSDDDDW